MITSGKGPGPGGRNTAATCSLLAAPPAPKIFIQWAPDTFTPGGDAVSITASPTCGGVGEGVVAARPAQPDKINAVTTIGTKARVTSRTLSHASTNAAPAA